MQPLDIVILSNAPGEITTWVRPVVKSLRQQLGNDVDLVRISVILSPCPHSTGKEAAIALSYPQVDRVLPAEEFWQFLLRGKTKENWDWRRRGMVIFLGGDQFYTVVVGKRLGYSTLVYAEWDARWYRWIDRFAVMNQTVIAKIPQAHRHKCTVVGDLIADVSLEVSSDRQERNSSTPLIGLLVGSKPAKLSQGVPLCLAIAEKIQQQLPQASFVIPVAPTLNLTTIAKYAALETNYLVSKLGNVSGKLFYTQFESPVSGVYDGRGGVSLTANPYLITSGGTKISLITEFPAYNTLSQCQLCLTTVGANTAELASLGIPMIVLLPTQQLDAMRAWDGLPGILANLPGVGTILAKSINWLVVRQGRLFAWPNIWAKGEIVPELVGKLQPEDVANLVLDYLQHPQKLQIMRARLRRVRGTSGAAERLAIVVKCQLE